MELSGRSETLGLSLAAGTTAAVLGAIAIERRSLWLDEAFDVAWSKLAWADLVDIAFHREGSQALYLFMLKPWLAVTSDNEWVARAPSILFAALAAALLVVVGTRVFDSRWVGFGAGVLLATNAFSVSWSQQIRQYSLAMLLAVVVTYLLVVALEGHAWSRWLVYGVVAGLSVYAHFFVALVVASHGLAVASTRRAALLKRWGTAAAIAAAIALPAVNFTLNHDNGQISWVPELSSEYVRGAIHTASGQSWLALALGVVALLVFSFEIGRTTRDRWRYVLVPAWLLVPLALALAISSLKPMLVDRYLIVSLPALALAVAYTVFRLGHRVGTIALVGLVAISLSHVRDWYGSAVQQEWRGAVQYVDRTRSPGEPVLVHPGFLTAPVAYYADGPVETAEELHTDGAWILSVGDRADEVQDIVAGSGYEVTERITFAGVDVWHVKPTVG